MKILITISEENLNKLNKLTEQDERDTGLKQNRSRKIGELIHKEYIRYEEFFKEQENEQ